MYKVTVNWAISFHFLFHTGIWKRNSLGVCQEHFPRESRTEIIFPRGQGKFSKGLILLKTSLLGDHTLKIGFLRVIFGIVTDPGISGQKMNKENCFPYPCMDKKWNSPFQAEALPSSLGANFKNLANPSHPGNFLSNAQPQELSRLS